MDDLKWRGLAEGEELGSKCFYPIGKPVSKNCKGSKSHLYYGVFGAGKK